MRAANATPTFRQIEAFRAVAQLATATAAAAALGLGQPAVSRLVADLERRTGLALFDRRGRSLVLTAEGELFRQEVERSFVGLEVLADAAAAIRRRQGGTLRVASLQAYADGFVADAIGEVLQARPGLRVELQVLAKPELIRQLALERFDLGIGTLPMASPALSVRPLAQRRGMLLFRAGVPPPVPLDWKALEQLPLLALTPDQPFRAAFDARALAVGVTPRIVAEMRTQRAICRAVLAGGGVGLVEDAVGREFAAELLWPLPEEFSWTLALARPRRRSPSNAATAMARALGQHAARSG